MLETSFQQSHNISMTGGTEKLRFRLSAGYIDNNGVLITDKDQYRRMNVSGFISAISRNGLLRKLLLVMPIARKHCLAQPWVLSIPPVWLLFYPEGNMPAGISDEAEGLPFFTPANQIRWSNPSKTLNDNLVFS